MSLSACSPDSSITGVLPHVSRKRPAISRKCWPLLQYCCGCADASTESGCHVAIAYIFQRINCARNSSGRSLAVIFIKNINQRLGVFADAFGNSVTGFAYVVLGLLFNILGRSSTKSGALARSAKIISVCTALKYKGFSYVVATQSAFPHDFHFLARLIATPLRSVN